MRFARSSPTQASIRRRSTTRPAGSARWPPRRRCAGSASCSGWTRSASAATGSRTPKRSARSSACCARPSTRSTPTSTSPRTRARSRASARGSSRCSPTRTRRTRPPPTRTARARTRRARTVRATSLDWRRRRRATSRARTSARSTSRRSAPSVSCIDRAPTATTSPRRSMSRPRCSSARRAKASSAGCRGSGACPTRA